MKKISIFVLATGLFSTTVTVPVQAVNIGNAMSLTSIGISSSSIAGALN